LRPQHRGGNSNFNSIYNWMNLPWKV
jgi:hypothetical protein